MQEHFWSLLESLIDISEEQAREELIRKSTESRDRFLTGAAVGSLVILFFSFGCATLPRNPVPLDSQLSAQIPGMKDLRAVSGQYSEAFEKDVFETEQQYRDFKGLSPTEKLSVSMLILSDGADDGAFGAGLLTGWTQSGNRPEFVPVTGVSTGVFPPVLIDVEANGQKYDEMHVDGGVKAQLFVNAEVLNLAAMRQKYRTRANTFKNIKRTLYGVRNAKVGPDPEQVERKLPAITGKALTSLLNSMARSDIERIYKIAQEAPNAEFCWTSLPVENIPESLRPFDPETMSKIFEIGYEMGLSGDTWRKHPPGLGQN